MRIHARRTGLPEELADDLNISVTLLYYLLQSLREMGAPVTFSKEECTFYFREAGRLNDRYLWQSDKKENGIPADKKDDSQDTSL